MPSKGFIWGDSRMGYAVKQQKVYNKYSKKWDVFWAAQIWSEGKLVRQDGGFKTFAEAKAWCMHRKNQHYKNMTPLQARKAYL